MRATILGGFARRRLLLAFVAVLALAAATAGSTLAADSGRKLTKITVANLAVTPAAPLVLGVQKGFFRQQGLDVTLKDTPAAALLPSVVSGQVQFAFSNPPATLLGASNNLPIQVVASAAVAGSQQKHAYIQLVTPKSSGITKASQLSGKKVAVDTLYQLPHIDLFQAGRAAGGDPSKWVFQEVPFPSMLDALQKGTVSAAFIGEPFLSAALHAGMREILPLYKGWPASAQFSNYVTSTSYAKSHPEVVAAFQRAMKRSSVYANTHEKEVRHAITTFTPAPAKVANTIRLPIFSPKVNKQSFATWQKLMLEIGVLKKKVNLKTLFAPGT